MLKLTLLFLVLCTAANYAHAQSYYNIGSPSLQDLFVDPVHGNDSNSGHGTDTALKTLNAAWEKIPENSTLSTGFKINIMPGTIPESGIPNYLESRHGTADAPIIIQSTNGRDSEVLGGDLNVYDTKYLYLINITIRPSPAGDTFHCEKCDHLLLRGSEFDGGNQVAHETIKVNQSQNVFIESNDIHGADDNAIDFVAVQYGHVIGNKIHNSADWCEYAKGGSAYLRIEENEFYNCGTGGFTAGQGTGFEFMVAPWIHYEAYDIKFINNIVHDTDGAGIGVNGGYNILMAHNTLYKIGTRSHAVEVVYGARSCDGDTTHCQSNVNAGGWGVGVTDAEASIPNRDVTIANNVIYNPSGTASQYQHFAIYGPRTTAHGTNLPSTVHTDTNLIIKGNILWNGPHDLPLGIEDSDQGCQPSNTTCNESQLRADNIINATEPFLVNPTQGDFRPVASGIVAGTTAASIASFPGGDLPTTPLAAQGSLDNATSYDRSGADISSGAIPGAYQVASNISFPLPPGSDDPGTVTQPPVAPPTIQIKKITRTRLRHGSSILIQLNTAHGSSLRVTGFLLNQKSHRKFKLKIKRKSSNRYIGAATVASGKYQLQVQVISAGLAGNAAKSLRL